MLMPFPPASRKKLLLRPVRPGFIPGRWGVFKNRLAKWVENSAPAKNR